MLGDILFGFSRAIEIINILSIFLGLLTGITFGAIPGVGPMSGVALLIPLSYAMSPIQALLFLTSVYIGGTYGGQIAAILFRVPGSSEAVATLLDGYEMTKKGEAGKALGTGLASSAIGGVFGVVILMLLAPQLAKFALKFGPAEYFALCFLGLSTVSGISSSSQMKALISCLLGLLLATVGLDAITGTPRFIFGIGFLQSGIPLVPALIGLFAASEVFNNIACTHQNIEKPGLREKKISTEWPKWTDFLRMKWVFIRSAILGVAVGILPGVGATTASLLAYNQEVRLSKNPEKFGTGIMEGVAAPETSNNAAVGGAMVPLLSLGIPGSGTTAVLLGALLLHNLRPGPLLMSQQKELIYTLFGGMFLANILLIITALILIKFFVRVLLLPYPILATGVISFCVIGSLALVGRIHGIWIMFIFGIIGYIMSLFDYPTAPMLLGMVLGPLMETSFRRALLTYNTNIFAVITRPITTVLLTVGFIILLGPFIKKLHLFLSKTRD